MPLFLPVHGIEGAAKLQGVPFLYFDKYKVAVLFGNNVYFAERVPVILLDDLVPILFKGDKRPLLAFLSFFSLIVAGQGAL